MNRWSLIRASLWHGRAAHLGVVLGAMIATGALLGALSLGDCLRLSLRSVALQRLGQTTHALHAPERYFRSTLAEELARSAGLETVAPAIITRATATTPAGSAVGVGTQLLGVDARFWRLGTEPVALGAGQVALNRFLAGQLDAAVGDELVLRFDKPGALPADAVLGDLEDRRVAMRVEVAAIVDDDNLGRFSLQSSQQPGANALLALDVLAEAMGRPQRANALLAADDGSAQAAAALERALAEHWRLEDVGLSVVDLGDERGYQLQSRTVFIAEPVRRAVEHHFEAQVILGYLANDLQLGERRVPYAVVAAMPAAWFGEREASHGGRAPERTIWLSAWLADEAELAARVGDRVTMHYYVPSAGRRLVQRSEAFRVGRVVPLAGRYLDPELMPAWPGIADAEHQADWNPGVAIDLGRIRARDEQYWELYRGSPKAFIELDAGRALWGDRLGDCTAIRLEASAFESVQDARHQVRAVLEPAALGLAFAPVRQQALAAAAHGPGRYFGSLFVGLSLFLIAAAVLLTAMLFSFGVQQRGGQIGLLMAVGFTRRQVCWLLTLEGAVLAAVGGLLGIGAGLGYTHLLLLGLRTVWAPAVGATPVLFTASAASIVAAAAIAWVASMAAIGLTTWRLTRRTPTALLRSLATPAEAPGRSSTRVTWLAVGACGAAMIGLARWGHDASGDMQALGLIGAGTFMLLAWLLVAHHALGRLGARHGAGRLSWARLAWRAAGRRRGRSLAVIALLASGLFLTLAVGANRQAPPHDSRPVDGPTGGYQLMVSLTQPLPHRLNERPDGSADPAWGDSEVLAMRLTDGPEAACDNLNRPAQPRLAGVEATDIGLLAEREAFGFMSVAPGLPRDRNPWKLLEADLGPNVVPAIADQPTVVWALGMRPGERLAYTDEQGRSFEVKIVAMLEASVLQGVLLVDAGRLLERYPYIDGYRQFFVRSHEPQAVAGRVGRLHGDRGPTVVPTIELMGRFQALENTYLSIFLVLGALGLALGSVGLGVVVLRQVMDRRGELALLRAVGFSRGRLVASLMLEHLALAGVGLAAGVAAAAVALGAMPGQALDVPWLTLAGVLVLLVMSLVAWTALSAWWATHGSLLEGLREE